MNLLHFLSVLNASGKFPMTPKCVVHKPRQLCLHNFNQFVRGEFVKQQKEVSFLFDSGSDLSLISTDRGDKQMLKELQQLGVKPRSIQGTPLTYHGFLELDVYIGNKMVKNQRFHIVDNLVCPFVAGIDLISSLGPMYIDWELGQLFYSTGGSSSCRTSMNHQRVQ